MCRNITTLRGLQPPATAVEITAAARQYVRKVSGVAAPSGATSEAVDAAVTEIAAATATLLAALPPRRTPPPTLPPLRRPSVRARLGPGRRPSGAGPSSAVADPAASTLDPAGWDPSSARR